MRTSLLRPDLSKLSVKLFSSFVLHSHNLTPAPKVATTGYGHVGGAGCNEKGRRVCCYACLPHGVNIPPRGLASRGGGRGSRREGERGRGRETERRGGIKQ